MSSVTNIAASQATPYLDIVFKSATIAIAMLSLYYTVILFKLKARKDDTDKEKDRRIQWMKSLVLDHSLIQFYDFFDKIDVELDLLKKNGLSDVEKSKIDEKIQDHFSCLRKKFIDILRAIDRSLYDSVLKEMDDLQEHFTKTIFDQGINLSHQPKFEELIVEKETITKTEVIKILFSYRG